MKRGPVDVVVLALGEPHFDGRIAMELERQVASETIRVLDVMILLKDDGGKCWTLDLENLPPDLSVPLGFVDPGARGLFDSEDANTLFEGMVPGSGVLALAIEHTWAVELVNALYAQGVEEAVSFRVPAPIVDEAFASLSAE